MSVWLWVVVAFVAGLVVGAGVTALLRRGSDVERRMRRMRREYEQYQGEVARHFAQTGELLSRLRTAFDQLYSEVEERATALVAEEAMQRRLDYLDNGGRAAARRDHDASSPAPGPGDDRPSAPGFGNAAASGGGDVPTPADTLDADGDAEPEDDPSAGGDEVTRGDPRS